jgi:fermentation-respiration switch protein FrsA (DUF1100 family)
MRRLPWVLVACVLSGPALSAAPASAQTPFGHACTAQNNVRFCPTVGLDQRVPSFDGVPIDVDVTLPPTGAGPFPTVLLLHGLGGTKTSSEGPSPGGHNNDVFYAQRGYAVVTPTARGFGRSCGAATSRTPDCANKGWIHLMDQRYEVRDVQHLLGVLVDEGIADRHALAAAGASYGGGESLELAYLHDRVRLPDGTYRRWRSPAGTPLALAAAAPIIPWSDLVSALLPNGRFLDFTRPTLTESREPLGVSLQSFTNGLYAVNVLSGWLSAPGVDPQADLTTWKARTDLGEPEDAQARAIADQIFNYHQAWGIPGRPAPLLLTSGWTDDLFPVQQSLRIYNSVRSHRRFPVSLQFGDLGHMRAANKPAVALAFADQVAAFFDHWLKGVGDAPRPGSVTAFTQTCPKSAPATGPYTAGSWSGLHPRRIGFGARAAQTFTSEGGNPATAAAFDPLAADACKTVPTEVAPGTAVYTRDVSKPFTLLGLPTVRASIHTTGRFGEIVSRLWDVAPNGTQLLVTRGVYRLLDDQRGRVVFQLQGNGYQFEPGHQVKLELTGSDAPHWRKSNGTFSVRVSRLRVDLPVAGRSGG